MAEKWTYRCEYVRCGKPTCKSCPHGPYWYGYRHSREKMEKKYFGKADPRSESLRSAASTIEELQDRIFSRATATEDIALEILELDWQCDAHEAKTQFRKLSVRHHPDRGGSVRVMQRIEAAWSFLKTRRGWKG